MTRTITASSNGSRTLSESPDTYIAGTNPGYAVSVDGTTGERSLLGLGTLLGGSAFPNRGWVAMKVQSNYDSVSSFPNPGGAVSYFGNFAPGKLIGDNAYTKIQQTSAGLWQFRRQNGGALQQTTLTHNVTNGENFVIVAAFEFFQIKIAIAGLGFNVFPQTQYPVLNDITYVLGSGPADATPYSHATLRWFAAGSGTLSDADQAVMGAFGNSPSIGSFPGSPTYLMLGSTSIDTSLATYPGSDEYPGKGSDLIANSVTPRVILENAA